MNGAIRTGLGLLFVTMLASAAAAQSEPPAAGYPPAEPVQAPRWAHPEPERPEALGPQRSGFTLMLALGVGYQSNAPSASEQKISDVSLAGLNFGLGGFVTPDLAVLFRASGTTAFLDEGVFDSVTSVSGVAAFAVQYWPLLPLRVEAGVGFGYHGFEYRADNVTIRRDDSGFGLLLSAAAAFWQNERHALLLGIDYAPAFVEDGPVHNLGFTFGWQLL